MYYIRRKHFPGRLDLGKHKVIPRVTSLMKARALQQLLLEQKNLDLLENPYLTEAEEEGHMEDSGKLQKIQEEYLHEQRQKKMLKHRLMDEHLDHLNVTKQWE
ncbi:hypothetical protein LSAT2_009778 [Lamellibrachia satsuma]|nr:hypothetical protein LSAT2_009778 [Lamellibrachia satsuma]